MFRKISDEQIIYTLTHYEERMEELKKQINTSYQQLHQTQDDALTNSSYPTLGLSDKEFVQSSDLRDLTDIYERFRKLSGARMRDISHFMRSVIEEQETMNRIMAAYESLDNVEKDVLQTLYIQEPNRKMADGVKALQKKYNYSKATIFRWRKKAIERIHKIYDSDLTQPEIYRINFKKKFDDKTSYR